MKKHPSEQLALHLYRVNRKLQYLMSIHLKPYDITPEQWNVLKHVQETNGISQKELSIMADKDKTSITRTLDSLERRGAVRRQVNPEDRRSFLVFLTEEGMGLIERLQPIPDKVNRLVSRDLSGEELAVFRQTLTVLQSRIEAETAGTDSVAGGSPDSRLDG
ncbi:MarR family transcriptional regulator [Paenibacillus sp. CC-CFT747]|nr:MarR family transcriptional regulator [Paenibacillus sp. CC-CFT747]